MAIDSTLQHSTKPIARSDWWHALARLEGPAAALVPTLVFSLIHSNTPNIVGVDGQYHIKVAALMREAGRLRIDFPYLRYTILNQDSYYDHHVLLHLLQAPFTLLDLRLAAKLTAILFAALAFWGCYQFMARRGVRWPFAWLVLMLAISPTFIWRHSMTRAQSLSMLVIVVALWLIFERRFRWLVPLGFVATWLFDGFPLVLAAPLSATLAWLLIDHRLEWRPLPYLMLGMAIGLVVHPYFPNNVINSTLHLLPKVGGMVGQESVPVGAEWYPYSPSAFVTRVGPSLAVMLIGFIPLLIRLWRRERLEHSSLTLAFMGLGFLVLQARSQRIIEYFPGFAVMAAAFSVSLNTPSLLQAVRRSPQSRLAQTLSVLGLWRPLLLSIAAIILVGWLAYSVSLTRRQVTSVAPNARLDTYREAAQWLAANSPYHSTVFNTDWDDFPQLFYWNSHNLYILGLDPTRMSLYDLELYRLWRSISSGAVAEPSVPIARRFDALHVVTDTRHEAFLRRAAEDPGLQETYRSSGVVVFRVLPRT